MSAEEGEWSLYTDFTRGSRGVVRELTPMGRSKRALMADVRRGEDIVIDI